jgi:hypothetical protein
MRKQFATDGQGRTRIKLADLYSICVHLCSSVAKPVCCVCLFLATVGCGATSRPPEAVAALRIASTQPSFRQRLAGAKDLFYRVVAGDLDSLPASQKILEELGGADSPDAEVMAYTAAADLLEAKGASLVWDKVRLAQQGLALQDRAVATGPDNLEVRFLRGVTDYQLPDFLGRHEIGVSDLAAVAAVAEEASRTGQLDSRAAAAALVYQGKALEDDYKVTEAIAAWQAAVRIAPDSPGGIDAIKHLAEHGVQANGSSAGL